MNSATPGKTPRFMGDVSLLNTPKPQASSTVNRRVEDLLSYHSQNVNILPDKVDQSPAYLSVAISGMRELTDQLGTIPADHETCFKKPPPPTDFPSRASSSVGVGEHRESLIAESDADSSLGILRLENEPGYSETEDLGVPSEVLSRLRKGHSQTPVSSLQIHNEGNLLPTQSPGLNSKAPSESRKCYPVDDKALTYNSMEADLRLRLQKALAQRTLDRSVDSSVRMSQLSDMINDSLSSTNSNLRNDSCSLGTHGVAFGSRLSGSFGAENFISSFNQSQTALTSLCSESFQPAETAMARMELDKNSWHRQFGDLPVGESVTNINSAQQLTQNLELSAFSGVMNGDITINSSQVEDGKRRISMGEYFGLRTERLGDVAEMKSDDERPNFGNTILSPTRSGPHPPLVNLSASQAFSTSLDEVPTRDAGLDAAIRPSFGGSFDFSVATDMEDHLLKDGSSPCKSHDRMPPPLPRIAKSSTSSCRDTIGSHLSTSLPVYKNEKDCSNYAADISAISMDTGRRESNVASISHIARLLSEMSGTISTRCLVDNLMKGYVSEIPQPNNEQGITTSIPTSSTCVDDDNEAESSYNKLTSNEHNAKQKVTEWMSSIQTYPQESKSEFGSSFDNLQQHTPNFESSKMVSDKKLPYVQPESQYHEAKSVSISPMYGKLTSMCSAASDVPVSMLANSSKTSPVQRSHSTPKLHSRIRPGSKHRRDSSSDIENLKEHAHSGTTCDFSCQKGIPLSSTKKVLQRSRSMNAQLSGLGEALGSRKMSSSSQDSSASICQQNDPVSKLNISKQLKLGSISSPTESEVYTPSLVESVFSGVKNSSRRTDTTSSGAIPLQVDSTHTQLSWASVQVGSSVTQTFALRNRARVRVRLLVSSANPEFKLMGERGESLSDLSLTLHSEETRRILVTFSPSHCGPVVGKLVIRRISTSETLSSSGSGDRRLIPLFAFGGCADLSIEGAPKDRWSELFLNMCMVDVEKHYEASVSDSTHDNQQMVVHFSVRNTGSVTAFVSLQIATELPFEDCGVYVDPPSLLLKPGQCEHVTVKFEPDHEVLLWLNSKSEEMQLLANLWLLWSELSVWQRIRRVFVKHYNKKDSGPLSSWGCLYSGDLGVANELRDKQSAETVLAQAVHRIKVAVLVEREKLSMFDLDSTLVFQQLVANESTMLLSPPEPINTSNFSHGRDSPLLAGNLNGMLRKAPLAEEETPGAPAIMSEDYGEQGQHLSNDLIVYTHIKPLHDDVCMVDFPKTLCGHRSSVKVRFLNPSSHSCEVSAEGASDPFIVSTSNFNVQAGSYFVLRVLFKPHETVISHCKLDISVDGHKVRCYHLKGEGIHV